MAYTETNVKEGIPYNQTDRKKVRQTNLTHLSSIIYPTSVILPALLLYNTYCRLLQFSQYRSLVQV